MKIITTSGALSGRTVVSHAVLQPDAANREELILNLYPEERFQSFLGFGGAVTDSAAYVYSTLAPELRAKVIEACYGTDGLGYTLARSHIDSCDFSLESYCADESEDDAELEHFSLERPGKYIFPMLNDIALVSAGLHEGQRRTHRRRKIASGVPRALGTVHVQIRA